MINVRRLSVLLSLTLAGCVSDAPYKFTGPTVPVQLDDGWVVADPEDVGINTASLEQMYASFISEDRLFNAKSLLVIKDGKLVFEAYCRDINDRDRYGHIQSATKSITSLVFGIVKSAGYVESLDQPIYSIFPDKFPRDDRKKDITIRHLLTMRSGLAFDNDDFSVEIYSDKPRDPIRHILDKPLYALPGEEYDYRDCDPHLLSFAIWCLSDRTLAEWADEQLFGPLGIRDYYWGSDDIGTTMGAGGLHLKPRDFAKIGQLVLDHGRWHGEQIIDSSWIAESTSRQVDTPYQTEPEVRYYGFYWWVLPHWQAIEALGHGGNFVLIVPDQELVVVLTSMPDAGTDGAGTSPAQFHELVSPLVGEY